MDNQSGDTQKLETSQNLWLANHIGSYRWVILFVTTFTQATIALISQGIGPLAPFLISGLGLTKTQVGFTGGAVNVGTTLTALMAGRAVDIWGEKKVLVVGGVATGIAIIMTSRSNSFPMLIGLLWFTGLWSATSTPAGSKAIMTWFPFSQIGLALGIRQTGIPLGGLVAAVLMPQIAIHFSWQMAMVTMGIGAILGAGICQISYKDFPKGEKTKVKKQGRWTLLLRNRNIWLIGLTGMSYVATQFTIVSYLVLYLHDQAGQPVALASIFLALVQFGGIVGRVFWGYISDRFFQAKRKAVIILIGGIAAAMSLSMLFLTRGTPLWIIGLLSWIFGFSAVGWNGVFITMLSEMAGKEQAGTAVGIGLTMLQIGVLLFPPAFGFLVDLSGTYKISWIGLSVLMGIGMLMLSFVKEKKAC